jgi:hypothetical protein
MSTPPVIQKAVSPEREKGPQFISPEDEVVRSFGLSEDRSG